MSQASRRISKISLLLAALMVASAFGATGAVLSGAIESPKRFAFAQSDPVKRTTSADVPHVAEGETPIVINQRLAGAKAGDLIDFTEPTGATHSFTVKRSQRTSRGNSYLTATRSTSGQSLRVTFSPSGKLFGRVDLGNARYLFRDAGETSVMVSAAASTLQLATYGGDVMTPPPPPEPRIARESSALPAPAQADSASIVSLLVLYEPSLPDPHLAIEYLVNVANDIFADSDIALTLRIAGEEPLAFGEYQDSSALQYITSDSVISDLRDYYLADMVTFLRPYDRRDGDCGTAWMIGQGNASYGGRIDAYTVRRDSFSIVNTGIDQGYYCSEDVLAHELGHNFGAAHDRDHSYQVNPYYEYAYGDGVSGAFGTVMSYISPAVARFSNPLIADCNGYYCGTAGYTDVALAINNVRGLFADVYASEPPSPPLILSAAGSVAAIEVDFVANGNGGAEITGYQARCGEFSQTGGTPPITVTGLEAGTTYSCTVLATNSLGTSAPSAAVTATTTAAPQTPVLLSLEAEDGAALVTFTSGGDNWSADTSYTVTCGQLSRTGNTSPITVFGLVNGTEYSCSVQAANPLGDSPVSGSLSVIPEALRSGGLNLPLLKAIIDARRDDRVPVTTQ